MKKIISLFQRSYDGDRLVRNDVVPGAEWVLAGEGCATRKWDGTACLVTNGQLYKRYDAKGKVPPPDFLPAQDAADPMTGHWPGWVPVGDGPADAYHREAWTREGPVPDGTYELIGPKIQGNPERVPHHGLVVHGGAVLEAAPRDYDGLQAWLATQDVEGIVWWHPDGRMVKIKGRDFGLTRGGTP